MIRSSSSAGRALQGGRASRSVPALVAVAVVLAAGTSPVSQPVASTGPAADTVSFADDVLPIFMERCAQCHGAVGDDGKPRTEAGLNLLEYERVMIGSEFGSVVEAGSAENSFLLEMIVEGDMPEEGDPVPENEIAVVRAWIEAGAPNN